MNSTTQPVHDNIPDGMLAVRADFGSHFLSTQLPFHVIDTDLGVIAHGRCGGEVRLPPGQYLVEVTLPSGRVGRKVAVVNSEEAAEVFFTAESRSGNRTRRNSEFLSGGRADRFIEGSSSPYSVRGAPAGVEYPDYAPPSPAISTSALTEIVGATVVDRGFTGGGEFWVFVPDLPVHRVPTATFTINGAIVSTSLPVNPNGSFPLNSCRAQTIGVGSKRTLSVSFGEGRAVSQSIEGLVRAKDYIHSSDLLSRATELLRDKYSDPSGAVLGGLTLLRLGQLTARWRWALNLADEAPWLPDAQFLYAAVLLDDASPAERRHGLDLLLANAWARPMYSDGLSLAMELLRRWSDDNDRDKIKIKGALDALAEYSAHADWSAISLSTWHR